ncbi:MAG: hypothetical protein Aureis2KO_27910 [Aureisphaera sp.]
MNKFVLLFLLVAFASCKNKETQPVVAEAPPSYLPELYDLMQGSFNSEKQSIADTTYYNISLHMYPIWKDQGNYLYVEQALNSMQDKPYRQRVYELTQLNDSIYSSAVYTLPNDSLWIGKWKSPMAFDSISPSQLVVREGCAVLLKRLGENHYKGSTDGDKCKSTLRGASYATSSVEITPTKIESWDQGFDAEGTQVWGAEKGGYVFDKLD